MYKLEVEWVIDGDRVSDESTANEVKVRYDLAHGYATIVMGYHVDGGILNKCWTICEPYQVATLKDEHGNIIGQFSGARA